MDQLVSDIVGKLKLNKPATITVVADNFSLLQDEALFLKATYAIPDIKKLPFATNCKLAIQLGNIHCKLAEQLERSKWLVREYHPSWDKSICDRLEEDLASLQERSIIFISEVSRLQFEEHPGETKKLLSLVQKLKISRGHFFVLVYQNSKSTFSSEFLSHLQFMSDSVVRVSTCKNGYFMSSWWHTTPLTRTLLSPRVETSYFTCKIGKFYWSSDLFCFHDRRKVSKNFDLNTALQTNDDTPNDSLVERMTAKLEDGDDDIESDQRLGVEISRSQDELKEVTLPYAKAQDPEQSRIFYYPDKEDDIDEDDPDSDLCI